MSGLCDLCVVPEPWYDFQYHDGDTFDYGPDRRATEAEICAAFHRIDVAGYRRMPRGPRKSTDVGFTKLSAVTFHSPAFID